VNLPPTATLSNDGPKPEGTAATISFSGQHDPSNADTAAGFHYAYACDGNFNALPITYSAASTNTFTMCAFDDGPSSHIVYARIFDKDNGYQDYTTHVTVVNKPPVVTAPSSQSSNEGEDHSFQLGSFSDPGVNDNPWHVYVDWGDSSSSMLDTSTQGSLGSRSHTYADNGSYTVSVVVTDKDGGF